jgi:hypothetical protein
MKRLLKPLSLILVIVFAGCATIVGDKTQLMPINSTPDSATVLITDEKGVQLFRGQTPTSVTLHKSDGSYWGGKDYTVTISKEGYDAQTIAVTSSPNGWYIAGNIVFGGLIGWFIVDPFNGGMYNLSPEQITASMGEKISYNNNFSDGAISIVLLEDVPQQLRDKMIRIK